MRVILKLFGRGVLLWDDDDPFYDEERLLGLVPSFDPVKVNRNAHLDDTDRMLLSLIDGRLALRSMEPALRLDRPRMLASVIRLNLAGVIGFENLDAPIGVAKPRPVAPPAAVKVKAPTSPKPIHASGRSPDLPAPDPVGGPRREAGRVRGRGRIRSGTIRFSRAG